MSSKNDSDCQPAVPTPAKCAEALDKLLALSSGGASGELPYKAAAALATDLARELAAFESSLRGR
jgi:hypothetical protein